MNDTREARLAKIRELIIESRIPNQEVLVHKLDEAGFNVTQSSVSRDLSELRVTKEGGKYVLPEAQLFQELGILSGATAGPNLLVLKTNVGAAPFIGVKLDALNLAQIVGTISGDDTIFIATTSEQDQLFILKALGIS